MPVDLTSLADESLGSFHEWAMLEQNWTVLEQGPSSPLAESDVIEGLNSAFPLQVCQLEKILFAPHSSSLPITLPYLTLNTSPAELCCQSCASSPGRTVARRTWPPSGDALRTLLVPSWTR